MGILGFVDALGVEFDGEQLVRSLITQACRVLDNDDRWVCGCVGVWVCVFCVCFVCVLCVFCVCFAYVLCMF